MLVSENSKEWAKKSPARTVVDVGGAHRRLPIEWMESKSSFYLPTPVIQQRVGKSRVLHSQEINQKSLGRYLQGADLYCAEGTPLNRERSGLCSNCETRKSTAGESHWFLPEYCWTSRDFVMGDLGTSSELPFLPSAIQKLSLTSKFDRFENDLIYETKTSFPLPYRRFGRCRFSVMYRIVRPDSL